MRDETSPEHVLDFWLGPLDQHGLASPEHVTRWWRKSATLDEEIATAFGATHAAIMNGQRQAWLEQPRSRVAYVIVLDQFSRNMFRDTPGMFASDTRALIASEDGIQRRHDEALRTHERLFLYMPFMHSEDLATQERGVALFAAWCGQLHGPARNAVAGNVDFAERHRDIVARFGRFPHRNAVLGRTATPEELEFLQQPGSSF